MAQQDECSGCGRPSGAIQDPVPQCEFAANRASGRCVWLAMQKKIALANVATDSTLDQQVESVRQELASARAETAQIRERLDAESAARSAAHEQALQHKAAADDAHAKGGLLQAEVNRLQGLLNGIASGTITPDAAMASAPSTPQGGVQRAIAWLVGSRLKLGSISAALGLMLGAGGVGWWQHSGSEPAPSGNSASNAASGSATSARQPTQPASSTPTATPPLNALRLQMRLDTALREQRSQVAAHIEESLTTVTVEVEAADPAQREKADSIIRSVFAGAGLPSPVIRHTAASGRTAVMPDRPPSAPGASAGRSRDLNAASSGAGVASSDKGKADSPSQAQGRDTAVVAPVRPTGLLEACKQQVASRSLDFGQSQKLFACMKKECCQPNMMRNEECLAFDREFPFNCRP